jgi:hypothetical protein
VVSTMASKAEGVPRRVAARKAKGKCEHRGYPILVDPAGRGRRALCLACGAAGPIRKDSQEAREALLEITG